MKHKIIQDVSTVLLVGGGATRAETLKQMAGSVNTVVAADGGADVLRAAGIVPDAVIGDMDSVSAQTLAELPEGVLHRIEEQDSTDFDKCLRHVAAPLVLGYGFLGARVDHQLAAMTVLLRYPDRRCILIGEEDVLVLCPPEIEAGAAGRQPPVALSPRVGAGTVRRAALAHRRHRVPAGRSGRDVERRVGAGQAAVSIGEDAAHSAGPCIASSGGNARRDARIMARSLITI